MKTLAKIIAVIFITFLVIVNVYLCIIDRNYLIGMLVGIPILVGFVLLLNYAFNE